MSYLHNKDICYQSLSRPQLAMVVTDPEYFPPGWTYDQDPGYVHGIKITAPDGRSFYSRREVVCNNFDINVTRFSNNQRRRLKYINTVRPLGTAKPISDGSL